MSKLEVSLQSDNDAFSRFPEQEIARILRELADAIELEGLEGRVFRLRDINGNTVGTARGEP
jgi:hypothetical protein